MSHFTVTVALDGTLTEDQITDALAAALAPFDENKEVPRYVRYTREELIANGRKDIQDFQHGTYADYQADPVAYAAKCRNIGHLDYIAGGTDAARAVHGKRHAELLAEFERLAQDEHDRFGYRFHPEPMAYEPMPYEHSFPARLEWTDEQVHASELRGYSAIEIGPNGEVYSEYNPLSKWDWYSVGGRWHQYWALLPGAQHVDAVETYDAVSAFADRARAFGSGSNDKLTPDEQYLMDRANRPGKWVDVARKCDIDWETTAAHREGSAATYAFLTSEGKWVERGEMGWFGMSRNDKELAAWHAEFDRLVAAEADNAWFVLVDLHI